MQYKIAYFSMEIALDPAIPTYSGGLGVLAGDTLRAAADLAVPMVAVTLLHRNGYFQQHLDASGNQTESPVVWSPDEMLELVDAAVTVVMEGRSVLVRAWRYKIEGAGGAEVPVYLLDADVPENSLFDQSLTGTLYGFDHHYRLCQEVLLGIGGVEMLRALGHKGIENYHMNEGHSALLTLALLERRLEGQGLEAATEQDTDAVRRRCIFTTHTPVPAGHDQFPREMVHQVLGPVRAGALEATHCCHDQALNMTYLALRFSHYINGVAMHHGEVSRGMFPRYPINAITNGVHATTWICPALRDLFDRHIAGWRRDNLYLRYAVSISLDEIRTAHAAAKHELLDRIRRLSGADLSESEAQRLLAR